MPDPLIGITTYGQDEERHFLLPREYVDSVRRAGGLPMLIPPGESRIEKILERVDGLILTGGGDLDPVHYNGSQHESIYMLDAERDTSELNLAKTAIESGFPVLGICRGLQLINVALGGSLIEHLPDVVGEKVIHRLPPREPTEHAITVHQESRLAGILGETQFVAASWHHQAVREV
ncbi:MAG: gamma-glutamyl-gamma-aminobutyrate hydrolase family protein, partial [Planctomycetes bacterium]|nr:gamma-glutamyl-gamma-aminobutyrate hydrolase family protein [Planctomycetota bacterium]